MVNIIGKVLTCAVSALFLFIGTAMGETDIRVGTLMNDILFSTLRITVPTADGKGASIGTGFLYRAPTPGWEGANTTLLISNKHVLFNPPNGTLILNFHKYKDDGKAPDLGTIVQVMVNDFSRLYTEHPDPSVDLACLNVSSINRDELQVFYRYLGPPTMFAAGIGHLTPGSDVVFVGYPQNRFDQVHNLPLVRKGTIASSPAVDFNGLPQIVIDAQVYPGSSGSPVFHTLTGKFAGVVSQVMVRNEMLQVVPTQMNLGVQQPIGLGIVIKPKEVQVLIDHTLEEVRKKLEASRRPGQPTDEGAGGAANAEDGE